MYTPHYELFEKNIKIRFEKHLQFQSHEWIILDKFDNVDFIINGYKEIDKACGFNSKIEDNLWKYNLEEPPVSFQSEEVEESTDENEESKEELNVEQDAELFDKKYCLYFVVKFTHSFLIISSFIIFSLFL